MKRRTFLRNILGSFLVPSAMALAPGVCKRVEVVEEKERIKLQPMELHSPGTELRNYHGGITLYEPQFDSLTPESRRRDVELATYTWKKDHFEFTDFSGKTTKHNFRGIASCANGDGTYGSYLVTEP